MKSVTKTYTKLNSTGVSNVLTAAQIGGLHSMSVTGTKNEYDRVVSTYTNATAFVSFTEYFYLGFGSGAGDLRYDHLSNTIKTNAGNDNITFTGTVTFYYFE